MSTSIKATLLVLPLALLGCNAQQEEDKGIAATHPALAEELAEDPVDAPATDVETNRIYDRYRITTEEYFSSGAYNVTEKYDRDLAPFNESSHADAATYRTLLREGMEAGVNFAGKYTVVTVGCGTSCQLHFIVDRETGQIVEKLQSSLGAKFSPDSRLFVVNPPDAAVDYENCRDCEPKAYVLEEGRLVQLEK